MITIALIQADIKPHDKEYNFRHYRRLIAESVKQSIDLLVFPEMFACGFSAQLASEAEKMNGISMQFLREIAQQYSTNVIATMPIAEDNDIYNRLVWLSPEGMSGYYDKRHLFFGEEQQICTPGDKRRIFTTGKWHCLPLTCYDIRFPLWSRNRLINGLLEYDLLGYVCNFPAPREKVLRVLAMARAIENQTYVFVVNRIGKDGEQREHLGGTAIISPQGEVLQAAAFNREQIIIQTVEHRKLDGLRQYFPTHLQWDTLSIPTVKTTIQYS